MNIKSIESNHEFFCPPSLSYSPLPSHNSHSPLDHKTTLQNFSQVPLEDSSLEYDDYSLTSIVSLGNRYCSMVNKGGGNTVSTLEGNSRTHQLVPIYPAGVTRYIGRKEEFGWNKLNSLRKRDPQGGLKDKEEAFTANNLASLIFWGKSVTTNCPQISDDENETMEMQDMTLDEYLIALKKKTKHLSKDSTIYPGNSRLSTRNSDKNWQGTLGRAKDLTDTNEDHSSPSLSHGHQYPIFQSNPNFFPDNGNGMETSNGGFSRDGTLDGNSRMKENDKNLNGENWKGHCQLPPFDNPSSSLFSGFKNPNGITISDCFSGRIPSNERLEGNSTAKISTDGCKSMSPIKGLVVEENLVQQNHAKSGGFGTLKVDEAHFNFINWPKDMLMTTDRFGFDV